MTAPHWFRRALRRGGPTHMRQFSSLVLSGRARYAFAAVSSAVALTACQSDITTAPGAAPVDTSATVVQTGGPASSANPLASFMFYVDQASNAEKTADSWRSTRTADAQQ